MPSPNGKPALRSNNVAGKNASPFFELGTGIQDFPRIQRARMVKAGLAVVRSLSRAKNY